LKEKELLENLISNRHKRGAIPFYLFSVEFIILSEVIAVDKVAMYKEYIYKIARDKDKPSIGKDMVGAGAMAGGAALTKKMYDRGNLTGRETMWHNTAKTNVDSILNKGLRKQFAADPNNFTNKVLTEVPMADKINKVYLGRKKSVADSVGYSVARNQLAKETNDPLFSDMKRIKDRVKETRETLKLKVPTWKLNEVDNPELKKVQKAVINNNKSKTFSPQDLQSILYKRNSGRKGTGVFENNIGPEFIKGSDKFKHLNISELSEYIKKNPKRFAKGAAGAAIGATAIAAGAKIIHDNHKKKEMK
jgi:hypothetical protein